MFVQGATTSAWDRSPTLCSVNIDLLEFGAWDFFGAWSLGFGASLRVPGKSGIRRRLIPKPLY
jgi:hypothetical protein